MTFPAGEYKIAGLERKEDGKKAGRPIILVDGDVLEVDSPFWVVHSSALRSREGHQAVRLNLLVGVDAVVKVNGRRYDERDTE